MNECETVFGVDVPCDSRNLLNTSNFKSTEEHYIITDEDYNNAIECEGNCK